MVCSLQVMIRHIEEMEQISGSQEVLEKILYDSKVSESEVCSHAVLYTYIHVHVHVHVHVHHSYSICQ